MIKEAKERFLRLSEESRIEIFHCSDKELKSIQGTSNEIEGN